MEGTIEISLFSKLEHFNAIKLTKILATMCSFIVLQQQANY